MDTSEQYIGMSHKAWPYLKPLWRWDIGDFVSDGVESGIHTYSVNPDQSYFPLPRQDQLQEILGGFDETYSRYIYNPNCAPTEIIDPSPESWEQYWLRYAMFKKFNKTWNGEDWK